MNKADNNIVLAKPSGITLEQHNKDVVTESLSICQVLPASLSKYSKKQEELDQPFMRFC